MSGNGPGDGAPDQTLRIGVCVPAHNAGETLAPCLGALFQAGFDPQDIIVVDDGSSDCTRDIAQTHSVTVLRNDIREGAAAARNRAARAVPEVDLYLFVDADVDAAAGTKALLERVFQGDPSLTACFGAYDTNPTAPQAISRARNLLHAFVHRESAGEIASFWTGIGAVRRDAFESVGGFDAQMAMMEDVDFGLRLATAGNRIVLEPNLTGTHRKRWTLGGMIYTDLFHRAIPWARLLRDRAAGLPREMLSISYRSRISVLAVLAACCGAGLAVFGLGLGWAVLLAAFAVLLAANIGFLRFTAHHHGLAILPASVLVLVTYYLCGGLGFAWVRLGLDRIAR